MASGPSPAPGEPCQAAIGSEACPFNQAGGLLFQGAQGEQENKRQISLSLGKKKKDQFHLRLSTKQGAREATAKRVYGVLNIHELPLHSSGSWVMQEATRVGKKTPSQHGSFFLEAPRSIHLLIPWHQGTRGREASGKATESGECWRGDLDLRSIPTRLFWGLCGFG